MTPAPLPTGLPDRLELVGVVKNGVRLITVEEFGGVREQESRCVQQKKAPRAVSGLTIVGTACLSISGTPSDEVFLWTWPNMW